MTGVETLPASFPTPWAARAFALVSALSQSKWIDLKDFQRELIRSIAGHERGGGCIADEASYYDCWIEALTTLLSSKGIPMSRIELLEQRIRKNLVSTTHVHGDHDHDHVPAPIYTERSQ